MGRSILWFFFVALILIPYAVAVEHSVYHGFAEPTAGFHVSAEEIIFDGSGHKNLSVLADDDAVYMYAYVSLGGSTWKQIELDGTGLGKSWLSGNAKGEASFNPSDFGHIRSGEQVDNNFVVVYSCSRSQNAWDCHDGWQIMRFTMSNLTSQAPVGAPLAFPGAEGYGSHTRGAYSGSDTPAILTVDTLEAGSMQTGETSGSFEWAIKRPYPRIIVFSVGGDIDYREINDYLSVSEPYVTIFGQTAPWPGIILHGVDLTVIDDANDVVIQHIKSRPGDWGEYDDLITRDAFSIQSYNVILDHCSASFATDEVIALSPGSHDVTVSNCIASHPFDETGETQKGVYVDGDYNLSYVKSLIAYNRDRSPSIRSTYYAGINNMNYIPVNFIASPRIRKSPDRPSLFFQSHVGNYYVLGVSTTNDDYISCGKVYSDVDQESSIYFSDNICGLSIENPQNTDYDNVAYEVAIDQPAESPLDLSSYDIIPAEDVEEYMMENVGAFNWNRDSYDDWVVTHVAQRTGGLAQTYSELPEGALQYYEMTSRELDIPGDPHGDDDGDGYTNIEEWAHAMAQ